MADSSGAIRGSRSGWILLIPAIWLVLMPMVTRGGDWVPEPMAFLRGDSRQATIMAGSGDGGKMEIRQFEVRGDDLLHRYQSPGGTFTSFGFDPQSRHFLFTGNSEGEISVWPSGSSSPTDVFHAHRGPIRFLSISPAGGIMVTGGQDGRALVVNTRPRQVIHELHGHGGPVTSAAWLMPRRIVTGCEDGILRMFDPVSGALIFSSPAGEPIRKVAADYGPWQLAEVGGRYVVSLTSDGKVHLWDLLSMTRVSSISSTAGEIVGTTFFRRHHYIEDTQETVFEPLMFLTWTDTGVIESWMVPSGVHGGVVLSVDQRVVDIRRNLNGSDFFVLKENGDGMLINSTRKSVISSIRFRK
ncbi:MAG: hypothetical protein JJU11_10960 [Candidatus Sumerlaeia bacterium]|nr:hypothetical protein [Candidatus Sumerlaeia bacterium]